MTDNLAKLYTKHHHDRRDPGFSILKSERGELLRELIGRNKLVLDLGCRDGSLTSYFVADNQVCGVDIDQDSLARLNRTLGIETIWLDLQGDWLPLAKRQFDCIVAGEVLEHLYYPEAIIQKLFVHLKPGGLFIGSVPNAFSLKNRLRYLIGQKRYTPLADPTHINHFSYPELIDLLGQFFSRVDVRGLGRYRKLSQIFPNWFAFDLFFVAQKAYEA